MDPWPGEALALAITGFSHRGMRRELFLRGCPVERIDDLVAAALTQVPPRSRFHAGTVFGWVLLAIPVVLMLIPGLLLLCGADRSLSRLVVIGFVLFWVLGMAGFALIIKGRGGMGGDRRFQAVRRPMW